MKKPLTAVVLTAFNRPKYIKQALASHEKIDADYFCFIDYSPIWKEIMDIVLGKKWYQVICRNERMGISENTKDAINTVFGLGYEQIIHLEDDLVLDEGALEYLQSVLGLYKDDKEFGCASLYEGEGFKCYGWGTWKDRWEKVDWTIADSWESNLDYYFKRENLLCMNPRKSKVKHIGWNGANYSYLDIFSIRRILRKLFSH